MTSFTPEERKYVAETTMPQTGEQSWMTWECPVDGEFVALSDLSTGYNPETNDTQFRALDDWVMDAHLCKLKMNSTDEIDHDFEGVYIDYFYCGNGEIEGTGFSSVEAKIAAALASRGDSDG